MALVLQRVQPRGPNANDGEQSATSASAWGVLACSANSRGQIRVESEELLGKKILEHQCSPEVFDPNTRSELLRALLDSVNAWDASGTAENAGGLGLGARPASVQVHTMGENLAVIAPVNYILGGPSNHHLSSQLQLDEAGRGSAAASSLEQVAVEKARALSGYDRILYCRCLALPALEFDVVEVLAESASEDFWSQSVAASMLGRTALLRDIVDVEVEGEARSGGLSGKLVVPVFRRLPFQPLSLEGLLVCHRYGFPLSQSTAISRDPREALDTLAEYLSHGNTEDVHLWYASRSINGSLRVLKKSIRGDSVSLLVQYTGHSWQGKAWGTAAVEPGKRVTFADVLVEAYSNASAAVKELMPPALKGSPPVRSPSVLHQSVPAYRLDVSTEAAEPAKKPICRDTARKENPQAHAGHRHISGIKLLREVANATSVSLLIEGRSQNLTAKAWGTAYFSETQDEDDAYLEAYDRASETLKELLPPPPQPATFSDELASICTSKSSPQISLFPLVDLPSTRGSCADRRASDSSVRVKQESQALKERREGSSESAFGTPANDRDTDGLQLRHETTPQAGTETTTSPPVDVEGRSGSRVSIHDLGDKGQTSNATSSFRNLVKQLAHCPCKPSPEPAAPVKQSEEPSLKPLQNVLVVDDDLVNVKMIERILKKKGLHTIGKEDGQDIIDLCMSNGQRFDMILVDENMRYMNGSVAIEHLRRHEKMMGLPHTPVIVTTANTSSQDLARYNQCGMDGVLAKPINMRQLPMSLEAYFVHLQTSDEGETSPQPTESMQATPENCNATPDTQMFHELLIWKKVSKNSAADVNA